MNALRSSQPRSGEVGWRGQLHVDLQLLFHVRDRAQDAIILRHDGDVDVDRAVSPAAQNRARATGDVDATRLARFSRNSAHEGANPRLRYGFTHSAARSKLTSFRISAL